MSKFCESTYEEAFIDLLEQNGWEYTCGDDLHRKLDETIIEEDLRDYLSRKYVDEALADDEIDAIVANLRNTGDTSAYLTLRKVFSLYCGRGDGFVFKRFDGNDTALPVDYIDFETPGNNTFRVVNQFTVTYKGGTKERRPDAERKRHRTDKGTRCGVQGAAHTSPRPPRDWLSRFGSRLHLVAQGRVCEV